MPSHRDAPVLIWFRDDLRVADNPALCAATADGRPVVCLYVMETEGPRPLGGAARWWLAGSLRDLAQALRSRGAHLTLRRGRATDIVPALVHETGATTVMFNRRYEAAARAVDDALTRTLSASGIPVETFNAALLHEPGQVTTRSGEPFAVFTPFWRAALARGVPRPPLPAPRRIRGAPELAGDALESWTLEPNAPDWAGGLRAQWTPGETGAHARLASFLDEELAGYATARDRPDRDGTSRLSPHLRFGEVGPVQLWHAAQMALDAPRGRRPSPADVAKFLAELGWREFSYQLLARYPDLATRNIQRRFDAFPWRDDPAALAAWQRGGTGYPLVDAGMRQLWATGWMHNRVRMAVASFLIKHLMIDWRHGEAWFWDTLVDADPANNPASWQWVAGSGADAAPFFRIFNPMLQAAKFDPDGRYIRRHVPELAALPARAIHALPDEGADLLSAKAAAYPQPLVGHRAARDRALAAFDRVKRQASTP